MYMHNEAPAHLITVQNSRERFIMYSCSSWQSSLGAVIQDELFTIVVRAKNVKNNNNNNNNKNKKNTASHDRKS